MTAQDLGGLSGDTPTPWSAPERAAVRRITQELHGLSAGAVSAVAAEAARRSPGRRRWPWLTYLWR